MRYLMRCIPWLLWACAGPAAASAVSIHVSDRHGRPVADAVVTLTPDSPVARPAAPPPKTWYIDQKNETFIPYVQVFRPGDSVVFRNSDSTRHHVYSFSDVKTFQFVLRRGDSSPPMVLDKTGIAAVGCNIHDHMIAYLFVSAAPVIGVSDAHGKILLENLAPGAYTLHLWHPQLFPGQPPIERHLRVRGTDGVQQEKFRLDLIPDPRMRMDREHMDY